MQIKFFCCRVFSSVWSVLEATGRQTKIYTEKNSKLKIYTRQTGSQTEAKKRLESLNWVVEVDLNVSGISHLSKLPSSRGCSSVEVERRSFPQHLLCFQSNLDLQPSCLGRPRCLGELHSHGFQNHHLDLVLQLHYLQFHLVFVSKWGRERGKIEITLHNCAIDHV